MMLTRRFVKQTWAEEMARSCLKNKRQTRKRQERPVSGLKEDPERRAITEEGGEERGGYV